MTVFNLKFTIHFLAAFVILSVPAFAQTPAAPIVVSPVNLCMGFPAGPLTATGTNLQWIGPVNSSVGGTATFDEANEYVESQWSNKKTKFITTVANVTITSVDYTVNAWQAVSGIKLGIYNSSGTLLATSSTVTSINPTTTVKVSNAFNYKITTPGEYSIGIAVGSGQMGKEQPSSNYPITESTGAVKISGTTNDVRVFNNIQFSAPVSSPTAPVPSTLLAGTYNYSVTQTVNGKTSAPATIVVKVNSVSPPTVAGTVNYCQGATALPLTASGTNTLWTIGSASSVGGTSVFNNSTYVAKDGDSNKKTNFTTNIPNITLTTVDFILPAYQSISGIRLGIFDENYNLIATSGAVSVSSSIVAQAVTNTFNYTITKPGQYQIGIVAGSGSVGYENSAFPITEPNNALTITGATVSGIRVFNNIQFTFPGTNTLNNAPVPSTEYAGTTIYYVSQTTESGCLSAPAIITVNVNGVISTTAGIGCSNDRIALTATASPGYTLNWYEDPTGGSSKGSGGTFTTPKLTSGKTYYVSATNGSCTSVRVPVQAIIGGYERIVWAGSTSWSNAGNWNSCSGGYPNNGADATIPETPQQIILTENITLNNLILQGSSKVYLNGYTLTASSITGTGFISGGGTSKLVLNGTISSTIRFDQTNPGTTNALSTFTVNNGSKTITLDNPVVITDLLNITGASVFNSKNNLTLKATATTNANIGSLANGGIVLGNVKVQTYLTGGKEYHRSFRTFTSPVYDVNSPDKGYKLAGYKSTMLVTGTGGAANGFDESLTNGATIKYYNEPQRSNQNQYLYPQSTSEALGQGTGIYFYFRGNRNNTTGNKFVKVDNKYAIPENVVMEYYGVINSGTISPALTYTNHAGDASNGFNLIGNPYPSVIDWNNVSKTNVDNTIWVQKQDGSFAICNGSDVINGGSRYILPGQGFFVKANGANPKVTFTENSKAVIPQQSVSRLMSAGISSFLPLEGTEASVVTTTLAVKKVSLTLVKDAFSSDETLLVFKENSSMALDDSDIMYQGEGAVNLTSLTIDNKYVAINYLPAVSDTTEVNLYVAAAESGNYSLKLTDVANSIHNITVLLKDSYLNKVIDIKSEPIYSFEIDKSIAESYGAKRFTLVTMPILPTAEVVDFTVKKVNNYAELDWVTSTERYSDYFEVEQSIDGNNFYSIGRVKAAGNSDLKLKYSFLDKTPAGGLNYYRLKQVDNNGGFSYSRTISLEGNGNLSALRVYPNPAVDKIAADIKGISPDLYQITIYNINGTKLLTGNGQSLSVMSLKNGLYIAEVINVSNNALLGRSKFLKD